METNMENKPDYKLLTAQKTENTIKKESSSYFQEALSDFMYDNASGRAIRHLTDGGYTAAQIMAQLGYPTSFARIQQTITRHLLDSGTLLLQLPVPPGHMEQVLLDKMSEEQIFSCLMQRISQNGEKYSYMSCPFGKMPTGQKAGLSELLSPLTTRERDYILGIAWAPTVMYHKLNRRMLEIGTQLAMRSDAFSFYFLQSNEKILLT